LKPSYYDDLDETLAECWRRLSRGVADRRSPFHSPTVASIGGDGRPRARVVILRGCDPAERTLRFHTDSRSDKAAELAARPAIALTGYDPAGKIQIRVEGRASLHRDDGLADAAWAATRPFSRVCYGVAPGPGSPIDAGGGFALPVEEEAVEAGRAHFTAVRIAVESLEWLYLAHDGHRRARFGFSGGAVSAVWLAP
jgi:pyridoxine/pyridoxamine 5'-phosphate oxidase